MTSLLLHTLSATQYADYAQTGQWRPEFESLLVSINEWPTTLDRAIHMSK
jgi:hypothetical protein